MKTPSRFSRSVTSGKREYRISQKQNTFPPLKRIVPILAIWLILLLPAISFAWPVPDTGQTKCYNNTEEIPCPAPGQPFYGQDGNYTINPPSYTKLDASGNALPDDAPSWVMVRDNVTGLIWENKTNDGTIHDGSKTFTWCDKNSATNGGNQGTCGTGTGDAATDTEAYIKALNDAKFGGVSDWRMPTVQELSSLINSSIPNPGPTIDTGWFSNTISPDYWSSTTSVSDSKGAWLVNFAIGHVYGSDKSNSYSVRAVRGNLSLPVLMDNGDGTVTDASRGLMWQKETAPGTHTWQAALAYCEDLILAGHTDWRLPNRNELQSLSDYSHIDPAINPFLATTTQSSYYWSSTTYIGNTSVAWHPSFSNGVVGYYYKSNSYYVRAVRSGQYGTFGSLVISAPAQAAMWSIGEQQSILWDPVGITGNVRITLSRQGGKAGTFTEIIEDGIPNNGAYTWTVTGPASVNCVLKIEPLSDTTKSTTQGLFSIMAPSGGMIALPKTGQTKCYNTSGAEIACAGTEQDGEIQAGVAWPSPRFVDNGDQTVTDNLTGLIWTKDANLMKTRNPGFDADSTGGDGAVIWQHALDYIKKLNLENYLGHNDWRLPNVIELETLVNVGQANSSIWLISQGFINTQADSYWSSSTYVSSSDKAWIVDTGGGATQYGLKTVHWYVWPVRSKVDPFVKTVFSKS